MSEETTSTGTSVNLGTIVKEYLTSIEAKQGTDNTPQFDSEKGFLERACVLLDLARKQKDEPTEAYLKEVIQERLNKGNNYVAAYQQAQKTLDGVVEEAQVDETSNGKKKARGYPETVSSEVSEVISRYEQAQPQDTFSERDIIIILKYNNKLPDNYSIFSKIRLGRCFDVVKVVKNKPMYSAESIRRFIEVIEDYSYSGNVLRMNICRNLGLLTSQASKLINHESIKKYFTNLFDLLEIKYKEPVFVYKTKDYDTIISEMRKLVDSNYLKGVKEATTPKEAKAKISGNGNGALLDFSGIETHLGLTKGPIVGKPVQDRIERLLGMPQTPEKGDPGYSLAKVNKLRERILALIPK